MMYDDQCLELAEHFLMEAIAKGHVTKKKAEELAQHIQDEIESWLEGNNL